MALALVGKMERTLWGKQPVRLGQLNLGVYATGGVAYTERFFNLSRVRQIRPAGPIRFNGKTYHVIVDVANKKLQAWVEGAAVFAEEADTTNLTAMTIDFLVIGDNQ